MNKVFKIIAIISFLFPIIYFNFIVWYGDVYLRNEIDGLYQYLYYLYYLINHWTSGEMGYSQVTYPIGIGIISLIAYKFTKK